MDDGPAKQCINAIHIQRQNNKSWESCPYSRTKFFITTQYGPLQAFGCLACFTTERRKMNCFKVGQLGFLIIVHQLLLNGKWLGLDGSLQSTSLRKVVSFECMKMTRPRTHIKNSSSHAPPLLLKWLGKKNTVFTKSLLFLSKRSPKYYLVSLLEGKGGQEL